MNRRVFAAFNLDAAASAAVAVLVGGLKSKIEPGFERYIRFAPPENWHVTLSFLGYQGEDGLMRITDALALISKKFSVQNMTFVRLRYGPPGTSPRMIWLETDNETSQRLSEIKKAFEDEIYEKGVRFKRESRRFAGHLTLARFEAGYKNGGLPPLDREVNIVSRAGSIDLVESILKRSGAEYQTLQKFLLNP
jgi:2'-5' RNA ligase